MLGDFGFGEVQVHLHALVEQFGCLGGVAEAIWLYSNGIIIFPSIDITPYFLPFIAVIVLLLSEYVND